MTRRARRSVEVRREEILSATIELLDRIGLAATRVADVADELGISPSLVFYHFGTKDALVAHAFAHAVERDLARLDEASGSGVDPLDRLRRVLRLYGPTGAARSPRRRAARGHGAGRCWRTAAARRRDAPADSRRRRP